MQNSYNLSTRLARNVCHRKFFQFLWNSSADSPRCWFGSCCLFIYFDCISLQTGSVCKIQATRCSADFWSWTFQCRKGGGSPVAARLLEGLREKLRAQSSPSPPATSRRETLPWNKHRHASEWEGESNITKESLCSSWDFYGCNYIPVVLGLTSSAVCFLKGSDGLWYGAHLVPGFWLWTVSIQGSPQSTGVPNPLTQNPTQAAQRKDNVLISISQKQTLFSGKATLQQCVVFLVLFSTCCSNSSAWDGALRDTSGTSKYRLFLLRSVLWHRDRPRAGFLIPTQGIKKHNQKIEFLKGCIHLCKLLHTRGKALQHKWNMIILSAL